MARKYKIGDILYWADWYEYSIPLWEAEDSTSANCEMFTHYRIRWFRVTEINGMNYSHTYPGYMGRPTTYPVKPEYECFISPEAIEKTFPIEIPHLYFKNKQVPGYGQKSKEIQQSLIDNLPEDWRILPESLRFSFYCPKTGQRVEPHHGGWSGYYNYKNYPIIDKESFLNYIKKVKDVMIDSVYH